MKQSRQHFRLCFIGLFSLFSTAAILLTQLSFEEAKISNDSDTSTFEETDITPASGAFTSNELQRLCVEGDAFTITRGRATEFRRDEYLNQCYPLEISIDQGGRSMGHCSDFVNYIQYGNARLVRDLPYEMYELKAERCPNSTYLHGEFPVNAFFKLAPRVRNIWLPNQEQIHSGQVWYFPVAYKILCKTRITCKAIKAYLHHNNITNTPLLFTSHSTPDPLESIESLDIRNNTRKDYNTFFHSHGHSHRKHTNELVQCWMRNPTWPTLTIVGKAYKRPFFTPSNVIILPYVAFETHRKLQCGNGVHICVSSTEGYGHYINEARALSSVVVTTDYAPMNEFVQDGVSGVLVPYSAERPETQILAPYFKGIVQVTSESICESVARVLRMSIQVRRELGAQARRRYELDRIEMKRNILEVYWDAVEHLTGRTDRHALYHDDILYMENC
ncbi:hypothetical protein BCR33DRAFT_725103 [Rhizoclosmatium globosum]|uniref:Glycosyl transferase family 1 domain-containing protein n=1 Tax=Rhizoclosmatium globosum TaxID=329046 RepID=A0A1Y2B0Z7_9FUNG|nr:hypothetical protein BCR33DRAFT_725103 [Rhizoclosmatium globosum]|eukprot:ORY28406.1 hypothetical protein BCR33DRAFT_725103 [Rhizoclosmatium globosum]